MNILLVGCAGRGLAVEFGTTLQLQHCTVTWVDEADMPRWGQLGCQGFIVLDGARGVVCKSTPPFMELGGLAFGFVEAVLGALLDERPLPAVCPGVRVRIHGLASAPQLNGEIAMCVGAESADGRCGVALRDGRTISVKTANLSAFGEGAAALAAANPSARGGGGGSCCGGGCGQAECSDSARAGGAAEDAAARAAVTAQPAPAKPEKREIFVGGLSIGTCANDLCLCAECECGASCQCNVADLETCEPCTTFRQERADAAAALLGGADASAAGTVWNWEWSGGAFDVEFRKGGAFFCARYPRDGATWTMTQSVGRSAKLVIDWKDLGTYEMAVDVRARTMARLFLRAPARRPRVRARTSGGCVFVCSCARVLSRGNRVTSRRAAIRARRATGARRS